MGKLTKSKAKEILSDNSSHGTPLSKKQKKFFAWKAYGQMGVDLKAYNPSLAQKDAEFQYWYKHNTREGKKGMPYSDKLDYDYFSAYKNNDYGTEIDPIDKLPHFNDRYKRPNHETFSNESIYSIPENPGGYWKNGKYHKIGKFSAQNGAGLYPIESWKKQGLNTNDTLKMGTMYKIPYGDQSKLFNIPIPKYANSSDMGYLTTGPGQTLDDLIRSKAPKKVPTYDISGGLTSVSHPQGSNVHFKDGGPVHYQHNDFNSYFQRSMQNGGFTPMEKLSLIKERNKKRDSVQTVLLNQYPNPIDYSKVNQGMLNYFQNEPEKYKNIMKKKKGGVIQDDMGYLNPKNKGKKVKINSNDITMEGVSQPLLGISDTGDMQLMHPGENYKFDGDSVTEIPLGKKGIHIKKSHKGLLHKNLGIPQGKPIPASKLEIKSTDSPAVRKRKTFAKNAKKWKHEDGGTIAQDGSVMPLNEYTQTSVNPNLPDYNISSTNVSPQSNNFYDNKIKGNGYAIGQGIGVIGQGLNGQGGMDNGPSASQRAVSQFGPYGALISQVSQIGTGLTKNSTSTGASALDTMVFDPAGSTWLNKDLSTQDRVLGGLFQPYGALKASQAKKNKKKQSELLNNLVQKASKSIDVDANKPKRYVRPEDVPMDTSQMFPAQGTGTNYLSGKNGVNVDMKYAMGGDLKVYNGSANTVSDNPYLQGESVKFEGPSHANGGMDISYGSNPVEVEGGEPAMQSKKDNSLVVFGDMKIPSYGIAEIGDEKAKGKKFKSYVNHLNEQESKQNKILNKSEKLLNSPIKTAFDQLKFSSGEALNTGANMKLKDIADKKEKAALVQNAILDTAFELNLEPSELAKGKIKKAKFGGKYQHGGMAASIFGDYAPKISQTISPSDTVNFMNAGYNWVPDNKNVLLKTESSNINPPIGSPDFNQSFSMARKQGLKEFEWKGKKYTTELAPSSKTTENYIGVQGGPENPTYNGFAATGEVGMKPIHGGDEHPPIEHNDTTTNPKLSWLDLVNGYLPYFRPTNQLPLDPNQLAGEYYALSHNTLEPVSAQKYTPVLDQPYDISLQDQLNSNQSDFNSTQRLVQNNPAALSVLAGQKYGANSSVLGEQFRLNQANKANIYSKNRDILNDAQLKNLGILDQQYVRQSQAKSNTKAVAQQALNSISDKILQNKLENKTLGIYENLYNYRYDNQGRAWNYNGPINFKAMIDQGLADGLEKIGSSKKDKDSTKTHSTTKSMDKNKLPKGYSETETIKERGRNGMLVKAMKGSNLKNYC